MRAIRSGIILSVFVRSGPPCRVPAAYSYYVQTPAVHTHTYTHIRIHTQTVRKRKSDLSLPDSSREGKDCARAVLRANPSGKCVYLFAQPTNAAEILYTRTSRAFPRDVWIRIIYILYVYVRYHRRFMCLCASVGIYFIKYVTSRIFAGLSSSPHTSPYTYGARYTHARPRA